MSHIIPRAPSGKPAALPPPPDPIDEVLARCSAQRMPAGARLFLRAALLSFEKRPEQRHGNDLRGLAQEVIGVAQGRDYWPAAVEAHRSYFDSIALIQVDRILRGTTAADMPADVRSVLHALAGHANADRQAWPQRETIAGEGGVSLRRLDAILKELCARGWIKKVPQFRADQGQTSSLYVLQPEIGTWWPEWQRATRARTPPPEHAAARGRARRGTRGRTP